MFRRNDISSVTKPINMKIFIRGHFVFSRLESYVNSSFDHGIVTSFTGSWWRVVVFGVVIQTSDVSLIVLLSTDVPSVKREGL